MQNTETVVAGVDAGFLPLLEQHLQGACLTEASKAMRAAITACQITGKPAGLTIKFGFKPAGNNSGAVVIASDVKAKLPELPKDTSFFYADEAGNLHRSDPRQRELPLSSVQAGAASALEHLRKAE